MSSCGKNRKIKLLHNFQHVTCFLKGAYVRKHGTSVILERFNLAEQVTNARVSASRGPTYTFSNISSGACVIKLLLIIALRGH